ncbi:hypothetical protein HDU85_003800 [Gaertneriomyces sp. JEL0708]|nr:hypothetical protein HDU85_003800 [Gaertneriomyces sp. JEL0708]
MSVTKRLLRALQRGILNSTYRSRFAPTIPTVRCAVASGPLQPYRPYQVGRPGSKRTSSCPGCGASFQSNDPTEPGYLPPTLISRPAAPPSVHERSGAKTTDTLTPRELKALLKPPKSYICQRCHHLKHQNTALKKHFPDPVKLLAPVRVVPNGVIVCVVDATDFPASLLPKLSDMVGVSKPVIVVANKVDLLPAGISLKKVKNSIAQTAQRSGVKNLIGVFLTSAQNGTGLSELCEAIVPYQQNGEHAFFVGCANVGKSAIVNKLRHMSGLADADAGPVVSSVPGTTVDLVEIPITLSALVSSASDTVQPVADESDKGVQNMDPNVSNEGTGKVFDTPGLYQPSQISHHLTAEDFRHLLPATAVKPRQHTITPASSLFIGGLFRVDVVEASSPVQLTFYGASAARLPIHVCRTSRAEEVWRKNAGRNRTIMFPPVTAEAAATLPPLLMVKQAVLHPGRQPLDIVLAGTGWLATGGQNVDAKLNIYGPGGLGVVLREEWITPEKVKPGKRM